MEMRRELESRRIRRRSEELAMGIRRREERRKFDDRVKEKEGEDVEIDEERKGKGFKMRNVKEEPKLELYDYGQDVGSIETLICQGCSSVYDLVLMVVWSTVT